MNLSLMNIGLWIYLTENIDQQNLINFYSFRIKKPWRVHMSLRFRDAAQLCLWTYICWKFWDNHSSDVREKFSSELQSAKSASLYQFIMSCLQNDSRHEIHCPILLKFSTGRIQNPFRQKCLNPPGSCMMVLHGLVHWPIKSGCHHSCDSCV